MKHRFRLVIYLVLAVMLILSQFTPPLGLFSPHVYAATSSNSVIAAFFDGGSVPNNPSFWNSGHTMADINLSQINYLMIPGLNATSASNPALNAWPVRLSEVVNACHAGNTKALIMLGDNYYLHGLLANSTYRNQLITNITSYLVAKNLDGLYIDWEPLPGLQSGDQANMDLFLAPLYAKLYPLNKVIAMSVGGYLKELSPSSMQYLEFLDFQTYFDRYPNDPMGDLALVASWAAAGYDPTKFLLDISTWAHDANNWSATYADIVTAANPAESVWHLNIAKINSSFRGAGYSIPGGYLEFQNRAVAKYLVDWAKSKGYKGIGIYEINNDLLHNDNRSLLQTIYNQMNIVTTGDFYISASPSTQTLVRGNSGGYSVSVTPLNGFTSLVNLGVSGLPDISAVSFTANPTTNTSILAIKTSMSTPAGTYSLTITGVSGSLVSTTKLTLVVPP